MIRFKNFLKESQWMYHGTTASNVDSIKRNEGSPSTDRAVGAHFAADPEVARKFSKGIHSSYASKGVVYKTRRPTRSELETVPQKKGHSDQDSVDAHVLSTVFSHPDHKHLFVKWHQSKFGSTSDEANNVHEKLANKEYIPHDKKEYNYDKSRTNTFRSFVMHHGAYSGSGFGNRDLHKTIVNKFIDHMSSKGKKGLVYKNTNDKEIDGADSNKSYIIFEPHKLKIERHND